MKFTELLSSGAFNHSTYESVVGWDSRSTTERTEDFYGGSMETTTHYHGQRIAGKVIIHRPTGKTQYFLRDD